MTDTTTTTAPPIAFCQNCGKSLTAATTRTVGPATYCEPCLAARLEAARLHQAPRPPSAPYPATPSVPNPGLAALLGLIPGVGAMYNEQYAKGIVHLIVFAVLVALANTIDLFGLFIAGWEFYMVIEAHHTARARRDHTPLPNPFNLNDIGERFGFGKAWPAGATNVASVFHDAAAAAAQAAQQFQSQHNQSQHIPSPWPPKPPSQPAEAQFTKSYSSDSQASYAPPPPPSSFGDWPHQSHHYAQNPAAGTQQPWRETFDSAPPPSVPDPFSASPLPPAPPITGHHRFPAGAILLIGAGVFFLLTTTGIFHAFSGGVAIGFGLIGLAAWLFLRRMLEPGSTLATTYPFRTFRALRGAAWVGLTGFLFLLDSFHILRWNHSWPLYIILAGIMGFLERAVQHQTTFSNLPPNPPL